MRNLSYIIFTVLMLSISGFSQANENTAPIKWENYKISDKKINITFPKLPVRLDLYNQCKQIAGDQYYAYADDVIYELKIYEKSDRKIPAFCTEKEFFSENSFTNFLSDFQTKSNFGNMQSVERGGNKFLKFDSETESHKYIKWLLNDYKNFRWFELTISTYKNKILNENQFIDSLKMKSNSSAFEIRDGSQVLLGDALTDQKNGEEQREISNPSKDEKASVLNIITKPKPKYTDGARESNVTGNVRMRVVFLTNGSIGSVVPVNDFDKGLTEQAIIAARKMAFRPMRYGDKKVNVTKVVVYNFTIY